MAHTLADLATAIGWRASVLDGEAFSAAEVNPRSIVIVATQGHGDEEALEKAVLAGRSVGGAGDTAGPAFVGLVASRRRGEAVLGALADRGVPSHLLERVRVPVGIDLGHTAHREIAVAILAELVQLRASGDLTQAGTGMPAAAAPTEARDPVCGMTVPADESSRPFVHEGVTYYFCCPGCRRAFERDPAAYLSSQEA
jgi:xanthine dehydrogenase accessory factor